MTRRILLPAALLLAFATAAPAATSAAATRATAPPAAAGIGEKRIVGDRQYPATFTFAPDGRIFYGTRFKGTVAIWDPVTKKGTVFYTVTHLAHNGEQGLLGVTLHPDYPTTPYVYVYATRDIDGKLQNQILRITDSNGTGVDAKVIFSSNTTAGVYHDGGRVLFGPDGMLYAIVGDAHNSANSQDRTQSAGKILRMTPAGKAPGDNHYPGREWVIGIRNSYGFTFDFAHTGLMWETENGPECNDELNLIQSAKNYAWGPHETCSTPPAPPANTNQDGPNPVLPLRFWGTTIAPTGAVFCDGCGLTGAEGRLFFGAYNTGQIREDILTSDRMDIVSQSIVHTHGSGILSMERGTDGSIYFSDATAIYQLTNT
ncbi:MAG TPA: PQQ-dependent sugar dehydrogenase [Actinomycetota bacterium]